MLPADPPSSSDDMTLDVLTTLFDEPAQAAAPGATLTPRVGPSVLVGARTVVELSTVPETRTFVEMWTDGACKGNPGPGGWGAWMRSDGRERELFGGEPLTTNNRMELSAVIEGLRALTRPCAVTLHVDSTYVMNGMSRWLAGWKRNGWLTGEKKPVKNKELWQALESEIQRHTVTWVWVKGHSGDEGNERADGLANRGVEVGRATPTMPGG